jgi:hypothetical protein
MDVMHEHEATLRMFDHWQAVWDGHMKAVQKRREQTALSRTKSNVVSSEAAGSGDSDRAIGAPAARRNQVRKSATPGGVPRP